MKFLDCRGGEGESTWGDNDLAPNDPAKATGCPAERLGALMEECNELIAIFVKSIKTAQENKKP